MKPITIKITTFYRESTQEWVGEVDIDVPDDYKGIHRWTGKTEEEAKRAVYALLGYELLSMDQTIEEIQKETSLLSSNL